MKPTFHMALLGSAALVLISTLPALAVVMLSAGTEVRLEGDPAGTIIATTKTGPDGKFEFKGLKAGNYHLILPLGSTTANSYLGTTVVNGAQLELQGSFVITVTAVNDAPSVTDAKLIKVGQGELSLKSLVGTDGGIWRTRNAIPIATDGGTIRGSFKIAENESPRPQNRTITVNGQAGNDSVTDSPMPVVPGAASTPKVDQPSGSGARTVQGNYIGTDVSETKANVPGTADGSVWKNISAPTIANVNGSNTVLLGITVQPSATGKGLFISSIADGGLAQRLGLRQDDQLLAINGKQLNSHTDLVGQLQIVANQLGAAPGAPTEMGRYIFAGVTLDFLRVEQPHAVELRRKQVATSTGNQGDPMPDKAALLLAAGGAIAAAKVQGDPSQNPGDSTQRRVGSGVDIGAFEFRTNPTTNSGPLAPIAADTNFAQGNPLVHIRARIAAGDPEAWRYQEKNGELWYYRADKQWLVLRKGTWLPFNDVAVGIRDSVDSGAGRKLIPTPADLDADGLPDNATSGTKLLPGPADVNRDGLPSRSLIPGVRLPQRTAPNNGNNGSPVRRAPLGGKR